METQTPARLFLRTELRESAFRLWEETLHQAVFLYPSPLKFVPEQLQLTTALSRIRDAKLSLYRFNWPTKINMKKFREIYHDFFVNIDGDSIRIGPRIVRINEPHKFKTTVLPTDVVLEITTEQRPVLHQIMDACAKLVSMLVIPSFRLRNVDRSEVEPIAATLIESYDVAVCYDGNDAVIL